MPLLKFSNGQSIIGLLAFIRSVHSCILTNGPFAAKPSHGVQKHLAWTQTTLETLKEFLRYGTLLVFLPHVRFFTCVLFFFLEIPNFLSEDECDYIITLASENELMNSVAKGGLTEADNWKFDPYSE